MRCRRLGGVHDAAPFITDIRGRVVGAAGRQLAVAIVFWLGLLRVSTSLGTDPEPSAWPSRFQQDANLFDVCFVNPQVGWAVGDRGTILNTRDGGQSWRLQRCPVGCRLESVSFIDPSQGWIAGGWTVPYTHRSVGVVLRTTDGGETWELTQRELLPWLTGVHFRDEKHGLVWGYPSAMYPAGILESRDAGAHWSPRPGHTTGWIDAAVDERGQGLLLERSGQLAHLGPDELARLGPAGEDSRLPQQIQLTPQGLGLLSGNQGLVRIREGRAGSWQIPRHLPDSAVLAEFDWLAIDAIDDRIWVAGVPGTSVLHSPDAGHRWELLATGQSLPIHALDFVDAENGWAVGALGMILATHDGGRTWEVQQGAGRRLAVMGVFGQPELIPWELVAQVAAGEGYFMSLEILSASPAMRSRTGTTPPPTRLHEATTRLGGSGANLIQALPAPDVRLALSSAQLRAQWDQAIQGDSLAQVTEYLVRQFRTWQPDLVVLADSSELDRGISELTRQVVLESTERAADPGQFPQQLAAGLPTWRVARLES